MLNSTWHNAALYPAPIGSACLGCTDCTGLCAQALDLRAVPQAVLRRSAGRRPKARIIPFPAPQDKEPT